LAGNLPPVRANSVRIAQLVTNLVSNASESIGDRDGIIRVVTRRVKAATCFPAREQSTGGESVQLEISDTGHGVPRQLQSRVFEPFFSTKSGRRGLGLAIVDGIVRSLRGAVWLESEPDKGTTIRICLPSAEEDWKSAWATKSELVAVPTPSAAAIVLLVEDEDALRGAVSKMLGKTGFSVIEAADGTAALDIIRASHRPIDLLVLDITIPGASSTEVFQEAARLRPEIPIIVTSAYTHDVAAASLQTEIQHFIRKPYRLADLVQLMRQARC
jgi:CheY-like chemotaxis protein